MKPHTFLPLLASLVLFLPSRTEANEAPPAPGSEWQSEILKRYPEIGKAGSEMNRRFVAAVTEAPKARPGLTEKPGWQLQIAREIHAEWVRTALQKAIEAKDYNTLVSKAASFENRNEATQQKVRDAGKTLGECSQKLVLIQQQKSQVAKKAANLRQSAKAAETPNDLFKNDSSGRDRAQRMRAEAESLEGEHEKSLEVAQKALEASVEALSLALKQSDNDPNNGGVALNQRSSSGPFETVSKTQPMATPASRRSQLDETTASILREEIERLKLERQTLQKGYGYRISFVVQRKLSFKDFPGLQELGQEMYQIYISSAFSGKQAILVTGSTQFTSSGKASMLVKAEDKISVKMDDGFSKMADVLVEQDEDLELEQRLKDLSSKIGKLQLQLQGR